MSSAVRRRTGAVVGVGGVASTGLPAGVPKKSRLLTPGGLDCHVPVL